MQRPDNHVTRGLVERFQSGSKSIPFPDLTPAQKQWLEDNFPPKCWDGEGSPNNHLRYAGKVELAQILIASYKNGEDGIELDPELVGEKIT